MKSLRSLEAKEADQMTDKAQFVHVGVERGPSATA
jgi:hypothetical protein